MLEVHEIYEEWYFNYVFAAHINHIFRHQNTLARHAKVKVDFPDFGKLALIGEMREWNVLFE